ncbi:GNAT family N-acetyltransferase [Nemorincola caseinilytica]|uniref:GNAT family N-acetyltransferase n=1 Tax=Nemorincola caseinilytica TaxID=2054315 RepID=A0ABP8NN22_9BACT
MAEIRSLEHCSIEALHAAFVKAFADYIVPFCPQQHELEYMLHRRGYVPQLSFGAFVNGEPVAFTLNCMGLWKGTPTAYDTGTGTIPEYRRQGLAAAIFEAAIPVLKEAGAQQYLLEVMQDNTRAVELYKGLGFGVVRELDYYSTPREKLVTGTAVPGYEIRMVADVPPQMAAIWDIPTSWQNSVACVERAWAGMRCWGAYMNDEPVGYAILTPATGDVPQMAVAPAHRRKGIGQWLLAILAANATAANLRFANVDSAYEPFHRYAERTGMVGGPKQYEMLLAL